MIAWLRGIIDRLVDWWLRLPSLPATYLKYGSLITIASIGGGWVFRTETSHFSVILDTSAGPFAWFQYIAFAVGLAMIVYAGILDHRQSERKKVIVIEQRGLHKIDTPLAASLPTSIKGKRDPLTVDIREAIAEGKITCPGVALKKVVSAKEDLDRRLTGVDMRDITLVYGGIFPVPFTFLTGCLLDDESQITVFDWVRPAGPWRKISKGGDDGLRFHVESELKVGAAEAVLALSISFPVDLSAISATFSGFPLMHLKMRELSSDGHWSEEKQEALALEFLQALKLLDEKGVKTVHLVIAAPNSVVFNLGRVYDKRNLPEAIVYQYERSESPPYPWGVRLPTHGTEEPKIEDRQAVLANSAVQ